MGEGLNFWDGIVIFLVIAGFLAVVGGVLATAAIRLSIRDDYFDDPDEI